MDYCTAVEFLILNHLTPWSKPGWLLHILLFWYAAGFPCTWGRERGSHTCRIKRQNLSQHSKDSIILVTVWPGVISRSLWLLSQNLWHHIIHIAAHQTQAVQVRTEIRYARPLAKRRQTRSNGLCWLLRWAMSPLPRGPRLGQGLLRSNGLEQVLVVLDLGLLLLWGLLLRCQAWLGCQRCVCPRLRWPWWRGHWQWWLLWLHGSCLLVSHHGCGSRITPCH